MRVSDFSGGKRWFFATSIWIGLWGARREDQRAIGALINAVETQLWLCLCNLLLEKVALFVRSVLSTKDDYHKQNKILTNKSYSRNFRSLFAVLLVLDHLRVALFVCSFVRTQRGVYIYICKFDCLQLCS